MYTKDQHQEQQKALEKYRKANRRIHMDFHNPDFVQDIGKDLDAERYVKTLKEANVNGLVTFAKGHHGNSYYPTDVGKRHPSLDRDIMGEIIEECNRMDITPYIYYSVAWDKTVEEEHPEWVELTEESDTVAHRIWKFLCLNSPYKREIVFPQLEEIARTYDFAGFWLDLCWMPPQGGYCDYCRREFKARNGHSVDEASNHEMREFLTTSVINFIDEAKDVVKNIDSSLIVGRNQIWHTMMPLYELDNPDAPPSPGEYTNLWDVPDFMVTERSSPCGYPMKPLGVTEASIHAKYFRGSDHPFEVLPTRFIYGWGAWDYFPVPYLKTVFAEIASNGGVISCGDQSYPEGTLDKGVYSSIGKAFEPVAKLREWHMDKEEVADVCVVADKWGPSFRGAVQILTELNIPFAVTDYNQIQSEKLESYELIICPTLEKISKDRTELFGDYLEQGGALLADYSGDSIDQTALEQLFGVKFVRQSPYSIGYFDVSHFDSEKDIYQTPQLVTGAFAELEQESAEEIAGWRNPKAESTEEHYWRHPNTPPGSKSTYPGITLADVGTGQALFSAAPIFKDYWTKNHWYLKNIVEDLLEKLEFERSVEIEHQKNLEINLTRDEDSIQLHLITFALSPRAENFSLIEDNPEISDLLVKVSKKLTDDVGPIHLEPGGNELEKEDKGKYIEVSVPKIQGYNVLVLEQ